MINNQQQTTENLLARSPIIVVLGHVDHGKTTLLDYIKKTNLAAKEAGGITQSIGAYEIAHTPISINQFTPLDKLSNGAGQQKSASHKITFIDTPGHEAFSKMRQRGAKAADLAILVVAADDGVKPQTKESIEILRETNTPFIVAINKIDKSNADIERVKNDLMANNVLLEGSGGNISWQAISAKTGQGVNELLDLILLAAEMEDLVYNPDAQAGGVIIESKISGRKGILAVAIVKNGTLKIGDKIATPTACGKIKNLMNFLREPVKELLPSSPALILGFENLPQVGEEFFVGELAIPKQEMAPTPTVKINKRAIKLILKADVSGSLEALSEIVKTISTGETKIEIISESVGNVTDGDVKMARSTGAIVVGFKTTAARPVENLANAQQVKIIISDIIYELVKKIEEKLAALKSPEPTGELEILAIFSQKNKKQVIGGKVTTGTIKNKSRIKILRDGDELGSGKIMNLQKQKQNVNQANEGEECGILFESEILIKVNDRLIAP